MKIKKVSISKMYGSYTREIDFRDDVNLLVGINGSGKTTVLNCIDWMLRPDFASLAATQFDEISIEFSLFFDLYKLVARQDEHRLTISEELSGKFPNPITVDFELHPSRISYEEQYNNVKAEYRNLGPDKSERKLWSFLSTLQHPLIVSLDRSISAEVDDEQYVEVGAKNRIIRGRKQKAPLEKVKEVTGERYSKYRSMVHDLNERLKTKLVISAFHSPFERPGPSRAQARRKVSSSEISSLERRVTALLAASLGGDDASSHIQNYFNGAKQFAQHVQNDQALLEIFWNQYRQIDELAKAFDEYEKSASAAFESLGSYLKSINAFLEDSNKRVAFDETDGRLAFQFLGAADGVAAYRPLERLSSGERQILILLTFLAFVATEQQVFIVDEPELSLHPKWQSLFVEAVLSQAPSGTQIIMATHSPEIVGRHRNLCILLDR